MKDNQAVIMHEGVESPIIDELDELSMNGPTMTITQPSVYDGEVPFLTFDVDGKVVGKLWGVGGVLSFEGDADESARIFFESVIEMNLHLLQE